MTELTVQKKQEVSILMRPVASVDELISYHEETSKIIQKSLIQGVDYGIIKGTGDKPTLLKAGAERLNTAFGTHPEYELVHSEIDHNFKCSYFDKYRNAGTSFGLYRYIFKCRIVRTKDGLVVSEGVGSCSTLESKYVSRPRDCENTALKMAQKRAFVAATLHAFGLSQRFTQDIEDFTSHDENASKYQTRHQERDIAPPPPPPPPKPEPKIFNKTDVPQCDALKKLLEARNIDPEEYEIIIDLLDGKDLYEEFTPVLKKFSNAK